MTLRENLFADDESERAVSPVIGVILMVAITVILAAVIGTFVLQLGNQTGDTTPSVTAGISDADNNWNQGGSIASGDDAYRISVDSVGESVDMSNIRIEVRNPDSGNVLGTFDQDNTYADSGNTLRLVRNGDTNVVGTDAFTTGDVFVIEATGTSPSLSDNTDYQITILYLGGDEPKTLAQQTVELR